MSKRMITGGLLCAVIIAVIFWLRTYSLYITDVVVLFFGAFGSFEMVRAFSRGAAETCSDTTSYFETGIPKARPIVWLPPLTAVLSFGAFLWLGAEGLIITMLLMAALALTIITFTSRRLIDLLGTLAAMVYPQMFLSLFYVVNHDGEMGLFLLTLVLGISIVTDSMALGVGIGFGRHKLCPTVSPKKTIEGAIGGLLGGVIGSFIPFVLFTVLRLGADLPNYGAMALSDNIWIAVALHVVLGLVGSVFNQVGDIVASYVKRRVGIKDYSGIFPGHGGIMDRMDGMSFVLIVVFIFNIIRCHV